MAEKWELRFSGILVVGKEGVAAVLSSLFFGRETLSWIFPHPRGSFDGIALPSWRSNIPGEVTSFLTGLAVGSRKTSGLLWGFQVELHWLDDRKDVFCVKIRPEKEPDNDEREQEIAKALQSRSGVAAAAVRAVIPIGDSKFLLDAVLLRNQLNRGATCITLGGGELAHRLMTEEPPLLIGHRGNVDYWLRLSHAGDRHNWQLAGHVISGGCPSKRTLRLLPNTEDYPTVEVILQAKNIIWRLADKAELEHSARDLANALNL